ncbi:MAG: HAMP domain-containing histidine kinase [Prolixibacteraceae bacterium]|nr:HAMP domain-containing histidine kinase [Prolixibacteraceae bacterium]
MNNKKSIRNNFDPEEKTTSGDIGNLLHVSHYDPSEEKKLPEDLLLMRLQKMEDRNSRLENQIEQDTIKLSDVVNTNNKFLSLLAHDLRSPFNEIIGVLDMLNESFDSLDKTEITKFIHIALNSSTKTLTLLDNLLAWTITQNKEKNFNPVKVNVFTVASDELENFNTLAIQKGITLHQCVLPHTYVTADIQMVKAIFRNLISNAIKYSKPGGKIIISATEVGQFIEIEVADTGIGISQKMQKSLFKIDEFHSTDGTEHEQGTGLGLLFCKEFIEMHGGNISIESEPNKGCKVKFELPHYI